MYIHPVPKGTGGNCEIVGCHQPTEAIFYYEEEMGGKGLFLCSEHEWTESFDNLMSMQMKCPTCKSEAIKIDGVDDDQAYAECELGHIYLIEKGENNGGTTGDI